MRSKLLQTAIAGLLTAIGTVAIAAPAPWEDGYEYKRDPNAGDIHVWACRTAAKKDLCNVEHYTTTKANLTQTVATACSPKRVFPNDMIQPAVALVGYGHGNQERIDCR